MQNDGARADLVRVLERAKRVLNGKLALFFVRRRQQESVAARLLLLHMRRKRKEIVDAHHRRRLSPQRGQHLPKNFFGYPILQLYLGAAAVENGNQYVIPTLGTA